MSELRYDPAVLGMQMCERLSNVPGSFHIPARNLDIFAVRDFLDPDQCAGMISLIDAGRRPSTLMGPVPDPEFRTSESCNLDPGAPMVRTVEAKLTALTGIPTTHGETIQGQRYGPGQQFKAHHDFFFTDQPYWEEQRRAGGQRTWTAMIFLNPVEQGGQTFFPLAGVKVTPRQGSLLTWNNLDAAGGPNDASMHEGLPVIAGVKYIITKWYREGAWAAQPG